MKDMMKSQVSDLTTAAETDVADSADYQKTLLVKFDKMSTEFATVKKEMRALDEKVAASVNQTELQALKEEFENLQHDLRTQMLGVESTQKTFLNTFDDFKTETTNDKYAAQSNFDQLKEQIEALTATSKTSGDDSSTL